MRHTAGEQVGAAWEGVKASRQQAPDGSSPITRQVDAFSHSLRDALWAVDLFDSIPDIYFYVKDRDSRWITWNDASMRLLGYTSREKLYGATEYDFFPKAIAEAIRADDQVVIREGRRIIGRTEIILDELGLLTWVSTNKLPIFGKSGTIIGLTGTTRILKRYYDLPEAYQPFSQVMEHIQHNIAVAIDIDHLAGLANLSPSQFRKRFNQLFGIAPKDFILRTRLQMAARLLSGSDEALIGIALDCGFCDQSYFTKRFHEFFGMTPRQYRQMAPHRVASGVADAEGF